MRALLLALTAAVTLPVAAFEVDLGTARLTFDERGRVERLWDQAAGRDLALWGVPFCEIERADGWHQPVHAWLAGEQLGFEFAGGGRVVYRLARGPSYLIGRVTALDGLPADVRALRVAALRTDEAPTTAYGLNAGYDERSAVALVPLQPGVQAQQARVSSVGSREAGVRHDVSALADEERGGRPITRFRATSYRTTAGAAASEFFSPRVPLNLDRLRALRLWVRGDGGGQQLKIQLLDGTNIRDHAIPIDFVGWREVTVEGTGEAFDSRRIKTIGFKLANLPAAREVETRIDEVRAVLGAPAAEREVTLVDPLRDLVPRVTQRSVSLWLETNTNDGLLPAGFGLIACPRADLVPTIAALQTAAGLPSPRPGGEWAKTSLASRRSYLFITRMTAADAPQVRDWALRGGFGTVLLGQTWSASHGHHAVNEQDFPGGLPALQRAARILHDAGLGVGLHLLAPAVQVHDPYGTPVPDPRLVTDGEVKLAAGVDATATELPLASSPPASFPGAGAADPPVGRVVWIGDELVEYTAIGSDPPTLSGCRRGRHGTQPAPHPAGATVRHLRRKNGYFLHDLRTSLTDEVAANVATVANAIDADMLYLDSAELNQGAQWRDNGRLVDAFWRALRNPNTFIQASSRTPWSWHIIGRNASADGHDDIKGYLDRRAPGFAAFADDLLPIDCGWYFLYDPRVTADQFDYIMQRCLGFGTSFSLQTSPTRLRTHPEAPAILELAAIYERLRLSGLVDEATRALLREPGREYRLRHDPLRLVRTDFGPWVPVDLRRGETVHVELVPTLPDAQLGLQLRPLPLPPAEAATAPVQRIVDPTIAIGDRVITFPGEIGPGERLVWFPGEPPTLIPADQSPRRALPATDPIALPTPTSATLTAAPTTTVAAELRWVQVSPETLALPATALGYRLPSLR